MQPTEAKAAPPAPKAQPKAPDTKSQNVPAKPAAKPKAPKPGPAPKTPDAASIDQSTNAYPKPKPKPKAANPTDPANTALQPPPPKEKQQSIVPKSDQQGPPKVPPKQGKQPEANQQSTKAFAKPQSPPVKSEILQPPKKQPPAKAPTKAESPTGAGGQPAKTAPKLPMKAEGQSLPTNPPKAIPKMQAAGGTVPEGQGLPTNPPKAIPKMQAAGGTVPEGQSLPTNPPKVIPKMQAAGGTVPVKPIQKAPSKANAGEEQVPPKSVATNVGQSMAKPKSEQPMLPAKAKAKVLQPPKAKAKSLPEERQAEELKQSESLPPKASTEDLPQNHLGTPEKFKTDLHLETAQDQKEKVDEIDDYGASNHEKQVMEQIDLDLPRTFPHVREVDVQRASIRYVLLNYSRSNPHIGYCQGMSFPAAVLCANLPQSDANTRFQSCLEKVRELWLPGFHIFETVKLAFDALLEHQSQTLARSFQAQDVILDVFLLDAWLTMFARWLPFQMLQHVLDFVESQGFSGVLSLTVAVVNYHRESIVGVEKSDALLQLWKCLQWDASQTPLEELLEVARGWPFTKHPIAPLFPTLLNIQSGN